MTGVDDVDRQLLGTRYTRGIRAHPDQATEIVPVFERVAKPTAADRDEAQPSPE